MLLFAVLGFCPVLALPQPPPTDPVVLAYVTSWSGTLPDPNCVTHINYAFGYVNETFNGVMINRPARSVGGNANVSIESRPDSEERLRAIVALKEQNPLLKVLLSIGGWGSGRFSEMAGDQTNRFSFAADCQRVILEFGLDGIDLDWEYPTQTAGGRISASPDDSDNFTLLIQDIRRAIGPGKLLTFASVSSAQYVNFKDVEPYLDFVNIMTYDINIDGSVHHAGLYRSPLTGEPGQGLSCEESVDAHLKAGIPAQKLTLGIPFYGRGRNGIPNSLNYKNIINRRGVLGFIGREGETILESHREGWDECAQAPYWVDAQGNFVFSYETPRSIALKCVWLKQKGMLGAMYWESGGDDDYGTLTKAVYNGIMNNK